MTYNLDKPILCIIAGVAGSGKTTLGKMISQKLTNSSFISKDLIQNAFTQTERTGELYEKISAPTLKILCSFADTQLSNGKTPIIDGPFSFNHNRTDMRRDWVLHFKKVAEKNNATLKIIRCLPPNEEELKQRLRKRGCEWDKWKLDNWDKFKEREPINFPIPHENVYEIITKDSPEKLSEDILINLLSSKENIKGQK